MNGLKKLPRFWRSASSVFAPGSPVENCPPEQIFRLDHSPYRAVLLPSLKATAHEQVGSRPDRALRSMDAKALKVRWREVFDTEPPPYNRRFLESRLAYRIQELAYGGLKPETVE